MQALTAGYQTHIKKPDDPTKFAAAVAPQRRWFRSQQRVVTGAERISLGMRQSLWDSRFYTKLRTESFGNVGEALFALEPKGQKQKGGPKPAL